MATTTRKVGDTTVMGSNTYSWTGSDWKLVPKTTTTTTVAPASTTPKLITNRNGIPIYDDVVVISGDTNTGQFTIKSGGKTYNVTNQDLAYLGSNYKASLPKLNLSNLGALPKPTANPTSTPTPTPTSNTTTYLTAQKNGFVGDYNAWVSAGRPSGGTTQNQGGSGTTVSDQGATNLKPPTDTPAPASTTGGVGGATSTTTDPNKSLQEAIKTLEASPFYQGLPENIKAVLRMTVQSWDATKEINMANVLKEFENIKKKNLERYYAEKING